MLKQTNKDTQKNIPLLQLLIFFQIELLAKTVAKGVHDRREKSIVQTQKVRSPLNDHSFVENDITFCL